MRKVFWENPYQTTLDTHVAAVEQNKVLFEETIAYSFSGGQESDRAYVNEIPIQDSVMDGTLIYYTLPDGHGLQVGDPVRMTIDWPRRYSLMRLHFAAELVLEIVTQKYHLEKVGAHIAETKSRIDFVYPEHISTLFDPILEEFNRVIDADYPILTGYTDLATQRRYWRIEGFAQVPCGGTHVRSTREVGYVTLKRARANKGVERIEIRLLEKQE